MSVFSSVRRLPLASRSVSLSVALSLWCGLRIERPVLCEPPGAGRRARPGLRAARGDRLAVGAERGRGARSSPRLRKVSLRPLSLTSVAGGAVVSRLPEPPEPPVSPPPEPAVAIVTAWVATSYGSPLSSTARMCTLAYRPGARVGVRRHAGSCCRLERPVTVEVPLPARLASRPGRPEPVYVNVTGWPTRRRGTDAERHARRVLVGDHASALPPGHAKAPGWIRQSDRWTPRARRS